MEELKNEIEDAETVPLFKGIDSLGALRSKLLEPGIRITKDNGYEYDPSELADLIAGLESGETHIREITRTEGLREQAALLTIEHAKSFDQLSELLKDTNGIPSSDGSVIPLDEVVRSIQRVVDGEPSNWVSRSYGLRSTVERLISQSA